MRFAKNILIGLAVIAMTGSAFAQDCPPYDMTVTIQQVQLGSATENTIVRLQNTVVVTGLASNGIWIQEVGAIGTPFSGIFVYLGTGGQTNFSPGDLVDVIGEYIEYYGVSELRAQYSSLGCVEIVGTGTIPDAPLLTCCDLNDTTNVEAEKWEGVLVKIDSVRVGRTNDGHGNWEVIEIDSDAGCALQETLSIGTLAAAPIAVPDSLDTLRTITGIGHFDWDYHRLMPRSNTDIVHTGPVPAPNTRFAYPIDDTHIGVEFDRALEEATAENINNYYILEFDITLNSATMETDSFGVILSTSDMSGFADSASITSFRTLVVENVASAGGDTMDVANTAEFMPGVKSVSYAQTTDSAFVAGRAMVIGAVVTAKPTESYSDNNMFIQDRLGADSYGINCYVANVVGIGDYGIERGDSVLISGLVAPRYSNTQMGSVIDTLMIKGTGVGLIQPWVVDLDSARTERLEGMLIKIENTTVFTDSIGWGEWSIWSEIDSLDSLAVTDIFEPGIDWYNPTTGDDIGYIVGPTIWEYGHRKICPRAADDILPLVVGVEDGDVPARMANDLMPNRPNPFNPTTTIGFSLESRSTVSLKVFDTTGREIRTLESRVLIAGSHQVTWDGRNNAGQDVTSGVYFYRLETDNFEKTNKMVLLR